MKKLLLSILLVSVFASQSFADMLFLKDNSKLVGKILQVNEENVIIQTSFSTLSIKRTEIQNIIFDDQNVATVNSKPAPQPQKEKEDAIRETVEKVNQNTSSISSQSSSPESWYLSFYMGPTFYKLQNGLSEYEGWNRKVSIMADLGVYATVSPNLLLGISSTGFAGSLEQDDRLLDISASMLGIKAMLFPDRVCSGFFLEGKISWAVMQLNKKYIYDDPYYYGDEEETLESDKGFSATAGLGIAVELNPYESALLIGVNGTYISAEFEGQKWVSKNLTAYLGILW